MTSNLGYENSILKFFVLVLSAVSHSPSGPVAPSPGPAALMGLFLFSLPCSSAQGMVLGACSRFYLSVLACVSLTNKHILKINNEYSLITSHTVTICYLAKLDTFVIQVFRYTVGLFFYFSELPLLLGNSPFWQPYWKCGCFQGSFFGGPWNPRV